MQTLEVIIFLVFLLSTFCHSFPTSTTLGPSASSSRTTTNAKKRTTTTTTQSMTETTETTAMTSPDEVADIVRNVSNKATEWKSLSVSKKIELLEQLIANAITYRGEWVECQQMAKGVFPDENVLHGYGYLDILVSGPATFGSYANGILTSLQEIERTGGTPLPAAAVRTTTNGKVIATVWPDTILDSLEAFGMTGELVLSSAPTKTTKEDDDVEQQQQQGGSSSSSSLPKTTSDDDDDNTTTKSSIQHNYDDVTIGGVAAILAAGNFDAPVDLLVQMFLKGRVCIYKPNPVNQQSVAVLEKILEPLISLGYVAFVQGGPAVGSALVQNNNNNNDMLDEIVLTGSEQTLNKIQWGSTPAEQEENKRKNTPLIQTPVCSELGAVNSWIIVPGPQWTKSSVDQHARAMAFAKLANNGHTCVCPQLYVVPKDWKFRQEFLDRLRFWLGQHPGAPPFYPGSPASHAFFQTLSGAELIQGNNGAEEDAYPEQQRPVLIPGVSLDNKSVLQREAWCPVIGELPISYDASEDDPMGYLEHAVNCVRDNTHGSLSLSILINDKTVKRNRQEFDALLADVPYGLVGVNIWPVLAHSMAQLRWGAFPGYTASGTGSLGNARLFRNAEKTILKAPFYYLPRKSLEIMSPQKARKVFSRLTTYKLRPNLVTQTALFAAVLFGL